MSSLVSLMKNYSDSQDENNSEKEKNKLKLIDEDLSDVCNLNKQQINEISPLDNLTRHKDDDQDFQLTKDYLNNEIYSDQTIYNNNDIDSNAFYSDKKLKVQTNDDINLNLNQEYDRLSPLSFHRSLIGMDESKVIIPKISKDFVCSDTLIDKITNLYKLMKEGRNMNEIIQKKKSFRNPSIYEKLVAYCNIDEFGTNFLPEIYNPHCWDDEDYYEALSKKQKELMGKPERRKKEKTKIEILTGTAKKVNKVDSNSITIQEYTRKKTKWDIPITKQN